MQNNMIIKITCAIAHSGLGSSNRTLALRQTFPQAETNQLWNDVSASSFPNSCNNCRLGLTLKAVVTHIFHDAGIARIP